MRALAVESTFHRAARVGEGSALLPFKDTSQKLHTKKPTNNACCRGCEEKRTFLHCGWESKLVPTLWRTVWRFLRKLKTDLPYDPTIPVLDIHREKTRIRNDTCTSMFIAAPCTIAVAWKQPKCAKTEERIKKMWYMLYTMEHFSTIKKSKIMPFTATGMDPETVILSEISQTRRMHNTAYMWNLKKKWYKWIYLQNRNRVTDVENKLMVTSRGSRCTREGYTGRLGLTYMHDKKDNR